MRITTFNPFAVLLMIGLSVLNSCTKEPITGSVSGTLTAYDPLDPMTQIHLEGIKVFLFHTDDKTDTLTYDPNRTAIVDSVLSDENGNYLIDNIPEGNYAVLPAPGSHGYAFSPENDLVSVRFSINDESTSHTINFRSPALGSGFDETPYTVHVSVINRPGGGSVTLDRLWLTALDWCIYEFPYYDDRTQTINPSANEFDIIDLPGKYYGFYCVTNEYKIDAYDANGTFLISYGIILGDYPPPFSRWQIDWTARTIQRLE